MYLATVDFAFSFRVVCVINERAEAVDVGVLEMVVTPFGYAAPDPPGFDADFADGENPVWIATYVPVQTPRRVIHQNNLRALHSPARNGQSSHSNKSGTA
jgi:hypothetical protein